MTAPILSCPPEEGLLSSLAGRRVLLRVESPEGVPSAAALSSRTGVSLSCLLVRSRVPLSDSRLSPDWGGLPLALWVDSLGYLPRVVTSLPVLRRLNLRVFLPADGGPNLTATRLLSSLGVETALVLEEGRPDEVDWEALEDLASYAWFGRVPHAPIEPFAHLLRTFEPHARQGFLAPTFGDPRTCLHLDREGNLALTPADLKARRFFGKAPADLDSLGTLPPYREAMEGWRDAFLSPDGCSACAGWRVCLGQAARGRRPGPGCRGLFSSLLASLEKATALPAGRKGATWQP